MLFRFLILLIFSYGTSALGTNARLAIETLDISERGVQLIKRFESCVLAPYLDVGQKWTVGWGHLIRENERDNLMKGVSQEQADSLLKADIRIAIAPLQSQVVVPLYQHEFDSLVSFVFNLGSANFKASTLKLRLNAQRYPEAALEFPKWNKVSKEYCRGIFKRRMAEMFIFRGNNSIADLLPEYNNHYLELSPQLKEEIIKISDDYHAHK